MRRAAHVLACSVLLGGAAFTPVNAAMVYLQRSEHQYMLSSPDTEKFIRALAENGSGGRTVFLGYSLHHLGASGPEGRDGGHLAPLPRFTGQSFYASYMVHSRWDEVDSIPPAFLAREEEGIEEFLNLINATAVAAFRADWKDYCRKRPEYRLAYEDNTVSLFVRKGKAPGYFLQGSGEVLKLDDDLVEIRPNEQETVLKFSYFPELKAAPRSVQLEPVPAFVEYLGGGRERQVYFIKLKVPPELLARGETVKLGFHVSH